MKKQVILLILCLILLVNLHSQEIFYDDFEEYPITSNLPLNSIGYLTGLSNNDFGGIAITSDYSYSGEKCLLCENGPFATSICSFKLLLGDKEEGIYTISWRMLATNFGDLVGGMYFLDKESSVNIYADSGPSIFLGSQGIGHINDGIDLFSFQYPTNEWILVENIVNLDENDLTVLIDGDTLGSLRFSSSFIPVNSRNNISHLGSIAFDGGINGYPFYIDDIRYYEGIDTSINELSTHHEKKIIIYPNPSYNNSIYIKRDSKIFEVKCCIMDLSGNIIKEVQVNDEVEEVNVNGLSTGIYLCMFYSNSKHIYTEKIIIN